MSAPTTIRDLLVKLGVKADTGKVKQFDKALDTAKAGMATAAKVAAGLATAFTGIAAAMGFSASAAADHHEMLTQTAGTLGMTTDSLQEMRHVFDQFPMGIDGTAKALARLNRSSQEVLKGTDLQVKAWGALGIRADQIRGKKLPELFETLADGAAGMADEQVRLNALTDIFGDEMATSIAPALADGAAGIRALREQARAYGLVMSEDMIKRGNAAKGQFQLMRAVVSSLRLEIGSALIPAVLSATNRTLGWVSANREWMSAKIEEAATAIGEAFEWVQDKIEEADTYVKENLGGWPNLFAQIGKVLLVGGIAMAIPKLIAMFGALKAVAAGALAAAAAAGWPLTLAIGAVVVAVAALLLALDDFAAWVRGGDSIFGRLLKWLGMNDDALASVRDLFRALTDLGGALGGAVGRLASALAEHLAPSIETTSALLWGLQAVLKIVFGFIFDSVDRLKGAIDIVTLAFTDFDGATEKAAKNAIHYLRKLEGALQSVKNAIPGTGLLGSLPGIGSMIPEQGIAGILADRVAGTLRTAAAPVGGGTTTNAITLGDNNLSITQPGATAEQIAAALHEERQREVRMALAAFSGGER